MKAKKFVMIFSLICSMALFSIVTYSWIARSWTPELEYSQVSISTTGALVIAFEDEKGDESLFTTVDVNDFLGIGDFVLKQVSSVDGINFVSADFTPILGGGVPVYDLNVNNKYIETEFWLKTQYETDEGLRDRQKLVYIHPDSHISYTGTGDSKNVELTIRVSLEIDGVGTYIFCADRGEGKSVYEEELWAAGQEVDGKNVFEAYPDKTLDTSICTKVPYVYDLNFFNGEGNNFLFSIPEASTQKVTLRIWLEGCDDYCINDIAGKNLSILIKFDSKEVESTK